MEFIDLTLPIDNRTPVFPGDTKQEIKQTATIAEHGANVTSLTFSSHFSTHIDAPVHMIEDGKTLTDFPLEKFIGKAIVVDARGQNVIEDTLENVKENDIVFFYTGHIEHVYTEKFFENNPAISSATARKLVEKNVKIVGLDSFSPDNAPYEIHKILLPENILIVENLVNLEKLIGKRFTCYILPLKLKDADGAPCRVIGVLE